MLLLALDETGERIEPSRLATATCPLCKSPVRAKCGPIVTWHWAHIARDDCDTWSDGITEWHKKWQESVPIDRREIILGRHRADIVTPNGTVVELQHSSIPAEQIAAREQHYGSMVWLFDARDPVEDDRLQFGRPRRRNGRICLRFYWKHPRKSLALCSRQTFLDLGGDRLLHLRRIDPTAPCQGWGVLLSAAEFREFLNEPARQPARV
jgi:hypothetical protein